MATGLGIGYGYTTSTSVAFAHAPRGQDGMVSSSMLLGDLFMTMAGEGGRDSYDTLIAAPFNMRQRFLELIEREVEHQRAGRGGRIIAKMNALDDPGIIKELYRASQAGVRVDLIVRVVLPVTSGLSPKAEPKKQIRRGAVVRAVQNAKGDREIYIEP